MNTFVNILGGGVALVVCICLCMVLLALTLRACEKIKPGITSKEKRGSDGKF